MDQPSGVEELSANDLKALVDEGKPVLIQLWASWCGPCKAMSPVLEALAAEFADSVRIVKLEIANPAKPDNDEWAGPFGVRSVPTFILFDKGHDIGGFAGMAELGQMRDWLTQHLAETSASA